MSPMLKGRGERAQRARQQTTALPRRARRAAPAARGRILSDPNEAFLLAFADALHDILEEELRLSA
jgi:hypothetical protein